MDLQNDILRISGEKNAAEKSHENFLDREIEFLVIFTSAEIDSEDLTKNNCKFKFDEPPGITNLFMKLKENEPQIFFQLEKVNPNLQEKLLEAFSRLQLTPEEKKIK